MKTATVRILVVDDFTPFRQWVRTKLETQQNFEIAGEAADALEGIQKAQELTPDLIVLDVSLPDINGIEAAKQLCRVVPSAKILFLSRHADEDIAQCALSNGAQGYVVKSDAERELFSAIEEVLRGDKFVGSGVKQMVKTPMPNRLLQFATLT